MGNLYGKLIIGENFHKTIYELKVGESGYSYPTALEFDYKMNGYLDLEEVSSKKKDKISFLEMKVTRTGEGKNDFDVDIGKVEDYSWKKSSCPFDYMIEEIDNEDILIAKLDYDPKAINYKSINNKKKKKTEIHNEPKEGIPEITIKELNQKLEDAISNEDYDAAAKLRDEINKRK